MDAVERVKNMVRRTLVVSPSVKNKELYDRAMEIAPEAVKDLTIQQFHAKYRLPVLRHEMGRRPARRPRVDRSETDGASGTRQAPAGKRASRSARRGAAGQEAAVREVLVDFAMALEKAESRSELVRVVSDVDRWVARIVAATSRTRSRRTRRASSAEDIGRGNGTAPTAA